MTISPQLTETDIYIGVTKTLFLIHKSSFNGLILIIEWYKVKLLFISVSILIRYARQYLPHGRYCRAMYKHIVVYIRNSYYVHREVIIHEQTRAKLLIQDKKQALKISVAKYKADNSVTDKNSFQSLKLLIHNFYQKI